MAEAVRETIDGHEYTFHPFLGMQGWRLQIRLAKILGPSDLPPRIRAIQKESLFF